MTPCDSQKLKKNNTKQRRKIKGTEKPIKKRKENS
jgi:hypothetical protein